MSGLPSARAFYLGSGESAMFAMLQEPGPELRSDVSVLLVPPFGWEEICSYRARRDWAEHLARAGHPVLRFDPRGSGDSAGSPRDSGLLGHWIDDVTAAARWLSGREGCERVVAIGISLGGLTACAALAAGAPIDELILWATPARGSAFVREVRAFARMEEHDGTAPANGDSALLPAGFVVAGGFALSPATLAELGQLDLTSRSLEPAGGTRALLLGRDGIEPDARLSAHLTGNGVEVTVAPGPGYGDMMARPHESRPPLEVFAASSAWLAAERPAAVGARPDRTGAGPSEADSIEIDIAGTSIVERPLAVAQPFGSLFGIVTERASGAAQGPCLVMLNAGAIRRVGPNRMWVECCRRWAAAGIPSLRLDLGGIGDADGDARQISDLASLYTEERVGQVIAAIDVLQEQGLGDHFVLAGLCSGAYWALHAADVDPRVTAACLLNPRVLYWDEWIESARDYRRGLMRISNWPKVLRGEVPASRIAALARDVPLTIPRRMMERRRARAAGGDDLDLALDRLRDSGKRIHMFFSENEPLQEELASEGRLREAARWPNLTVSYLPGKVHTLRPYAAQASAHEALDAAISDEIQRLRAPQTR